MKKLKLIILTSVFISIFLNGCTHLNSVSTTNVPKNLGKKVSVVKEKFYFLALTFSNDFIGDMARDLAAQCNKGMVKGILTKHESINYILFNKNRVTAEGYCVTR